MLWLLFSLIITLVLLFLSGIRVINQYERGVKFRLGRFVGILGPGFRWIVPVIERIEKVDIRVINNLNQSIYIDTWKWDEKLVYKKENGEWVEQKIRIFCPQPCDCSPPPLCVPPMPQCTEIKPWQTFNYTWDQTVFKEDKVNCKFDNTTIQKDCLREEKAEKGTLRDALAV